MARSSYKLDVAQRVALALKWSGGLLIAAGLLLIAWLPSGWGWVAGVLGALLFMWGRAND